MNFKPIAIRSHSFENIKSGLASKNQQGFQLSLDKINSWIGVKLECNFKKDGVYVIKFAASAEIVNSLLEVNIPIGSDRIRAASFKLTDTETKNYLFFTPFDSKHISFTYSTFGGFSTGKIWIKNVEIFDMLPVKDREDLKEKIQYLGPWYHQLNLNGIKTRNIFKTDSPSLKEGYTDYFTYQDYVDNPLWIWSRFKNSIPKDLTGKKVLDIACNNGFYSFELAKRGALVTGFDNSYQDIMRANFAKKVIRINNVEFTLSSVEKLDSKFRSKFDIVLCLGLLYHLRNPEQIINSVSKITNYAIFETIADPTRKTSELISDPTITADGYLPTIPWLKNSFEQAGFSSIEQVTPPDFRRYVFVCKR